MTPIRLFPCLIALLLAAALHAQAPQTTIVSDVVYRADGSAAAGTVLISWPAFNTADERAVAAGAMTLALGEGGVLTVALAPTVNANPAGTFYRVVLKLDDGSTSEEFWSVPAVAQTTISAVRSKIVSAGVAIQVASRQYVDTKLGLKADDEKVVHRTGDETVDGVKTFLMSPLIPAPLADAEAANKAYVDSIGGGGAAVLLDPAGSQTVTNPAGAALTISGGDGLRTQKLNNVRYADQFAGADAGAKIAACLADLPATGGVCDARGFEGAHTISSTITIPKPATLLLGNALFTYSGPGACFDIASNGVRIAGRGRDNGGGTYLDFRPSDYAHPAAARAARGCIEFSLLAGGTLVPRDVVIENLWIRARQFAGLAGIKWRASSSVLRHVQIDIDGWDGAASRPASGILFLGDQANGNGSYYNRFEGVAVACRAAVTGAADEVGLRFETDTDGGWRHPNANTIVGGNGRISSCSTAVHVMGSGNNFYGLTTENITGAHYQFGSATALTAVQNNVYGAYMEQQGTSVGFQFNPGADRNAVHGFKRTGLAGDFTGDGTENHVANDRNVYTPLILGANPSSAILPAGGRLLIGDNNTDAHLWFALSAANQADMQINGSGAQTLRINPAGGDIRFGNSTSILRFDGRIRSAVGNAALPNFAEANDPDTGIFWPAGNQIAIATAGLERVRVSGTQLLLTGITLVGAVNTVAFSATPTFNANLGNTQKITLTGNVTSSTLSNAAAGATLNFIVCQDAAGNRTFAWPSNVKGGMTVGAAAGTCSAQSFLFDGANAYALTSGVVSQ